LSYHGCYSRSTETKIFTKQIKQIKLGEGVLHAYKCLTGRPEGKRPLGRPKNGGESQDRLKWWPLVNMIMNLRNPLKAGNSLIY
jgi:hypothetical protein